MVGSVGSEVVDLVIRSMSNALSISISKHQHWNVVVTAKVQFNLIAIEMESFSIYNYSNTRITFVSCILLLFSIVYTEYAEKECTCEGNWKKRKGRNGKRREWTNYKTCR